MQKQPLFAVLLLSSALSFAQPGAQMPPHLLLGPEDFPRLNELARNQPWAKKQREKIIEEAAAFPQSYEKKYGLKSLELPPEGAQWAHLYVCPDTGSELKFKPPNHNVCPDNGKEYPGAPYDQIVYQDRAFDLADGAVTSALAFPSHRRPRVRRQRGAHSEDVCGPVCQLPDPRHRGPRGR